MDGIRYSKDSLRVWVRRDEVDHRKHKKVTNEELLECETHRAIRERFWLGSQTRRYESLDELERFSRISGAGRALPAWHC